MISAILQSLSHEPEERGQGLAEYALILGLVAIIAITALIFLGDTIAEALSTISAQL